MLFYCWGAAKSAQCQSTARPVLPFPREGRHEMIVHFNYFQIQWASTFYPYLQRECVFHAGPCCSMSASVCEYNYIFCSTQLDSPRLHLWFRQVAFGSWDSLGQQIFFLHVLLLGWSSSVHPATGSLTFRSLHHCWPFSYLPLTLQAYIMY